MADMTVYTAPSGALVFATGSMNFNWGLDGYNAPALHANYVNAAAQQMTRNVLAAMLGAATAASPAAPSSLTAQSRPKSAIELRWADNSNNETSFRIERSLSAASGFAEIASVPADLTSYTDRTVSRKRTYYYRVRAATATAFSAYSNTAHAIVR
jgi:fibronectin type 3 domain-containing protein